MAVLTKTGRCVTTMPFLEDDDAQKPNKKEKKKKVLLPLLQETKLQT